MAYIKTVWDEETEITSDLLNHLETQYLEAVQIIGTHDHHARYYRKTQTDQKYYYTEKMGSGSGADADTLRGLGPDEFEGIGAPAGFVCMFGGFGAVPDGWYLCDGTNGTPDMRDRFAVGAGEGLAVNATGGAASVTPTATVSVNPKSLSADEIAYHRHPWNDNCPGVYGAYYSTSHAMHGAPSPHGPFWTEYTGEATPQAHGHPESTYTGVAQENRPPYYALRFIMKG